MSLVGNFLTAGASLLGSKNLADTQKETAAKQLAFDKKTSFDKCKT